MNSSLTKLFCQPYVIDSQMRSYIQPEDGVAYFDCLEFKDGLAEFGY